MKRQLGECEDGALVWLDGVLRRVAGRMDDVVVCAVVLPDGKLGPHFTHWATDVATLDAGVRAP
jgi:hypothetical protein